MKVSVWYNSYGKDVMYGCVDCEEFSDDCLRELEEINGLVENLNVDDFEVEEDDLGVEVKGDGWCSYSDINGDGIGIFVVEDGYDMNKCKEEYDNWIVGVFES